jgi:hypothetical protein
VLVFPPPFDFVHIYTVKSYPHTLSITILLYTVEHLFYILTYGSPTEEVKEEEEEK